MKRMVVSMIALAALAPWTGALAQQSPPPGQSSEPSSQSSASPQSQMPAPSAQTPTAQSQGGSDVEIAADSLVGSKVRNAQGQDIGTVSKLFVDAQRGAITRVVIKQGGGLGMGGKEVALPWSAFKVERDQNNLVVTMQQDMIPQASQPQGKQGKEGKDQGNAGSPSASPRGDQKR